MSEATNGSILGTVRRARADLSSRMDRRDEPMERVLRRLERTDAPH